MKPDRIRKLVRRNETLRKVLRGAYRTWQYGTATLMGKFRQDGVTRLQISPHAVRNTVALGDPTLTGNSTWHFGAIADGDWDLNGVPVTEHGDVYAILSRRITTGCSFEEIDRYQAHAEEIDGGKIVDSCTTREEYLERWRSIEELYRSISRDGYKTQIDLGSDNPLDEIRVQIGRSGEILFEEGLHRLVIAQMLNLESIPVIVTRRHKEWARLRHDIIKIVLQRGFIHQPFGHADLDTIPQFYGTGENQQPTYGNERWEYIRDSLPLSEGTVLDIGAYFGYFAYRFEALGFECVAVEPDRENLAVLRRYRAMRKARFAVLDTSIFEIDKHDFDIVLALNIFHHLVRTQADYEKLVEFLGRLQCQVMYFEPDANENIDSYRRFGPEEFVNWVLEHSCLDRAKLLGWATEGRPVYLLTQDPPQDTKAQ